MNAPTLQEIEVEAKRCKPWLFGVDLDLSGRRQLLCAMQEAEDRLRVQRGLTPAFSEE